MLLKNLIRNLKPEVGAIKIKNISLDSRNIKKGDLFISIKGYKYDCHDYIDKAILKGAKVADIMAILGSIDVIMGSVDR